MVAGSPDLNSSIPENGAAPTVTAEAAVATNADESPVLLRSICTAQLPRPVQDGQSVPETSKRECPRKTRGSSCYLKRVARCNEEWDRLKTTIERHKLQRQFEQTFERADKFKHAFLDNFGIGPMASLTALVESTSGSGEPLTETDPRVQRIMRQVAVLSEPQINSLLETVKRIGNCGRLEVAPGSKDPTWLLVQVHCCVACASVPAGSISAPYEGGWCAKAGDIGGYDLHQNTGGTGYDKSSHAGWTEVWELAAPEVKEITRSQDIGDRFSLHGFTRGGEFGEHQDKDNARWLVSESQEESKLIFKADGQEVINRTIAVSTMT
jgi:hypothetical protein